MNKYLLMACVSFGALTSSNLAFAAAGAGDQSGTIVTSENADTTIGEIVVTAQKRVERIQDVPMSITAASAETLRSLGVTTQDDLTKLVPGFTATETYFGLPIYFIRGVGFFDTTLGVSPAVTTYLDQTPLPYAPMSRGAILDIERVEILKGPQGTLFGQNSTGGAINYIAAKPTESFRAGALLTYGRFNEIDGEGFVSGPLSDTFSARLAIRHESRGDWQQGYVNGDTLGRKDFTNGRLIVDWKPSTIAKFELQISGWNDRSDAQIEQLSNVDLAQPPADGGRTNPYPITTFPVAPNNARAASWDPNVDFSVHNSFYQVALRGDINVSDRSVLTSITSYARYKNDTPNDMDGTIYPSDRTEDIGDIETFSQELRLAGDYGDRLKWMIGGNFQKDTVDETFKFDPLNVSSSHVGPFAWLAMNVLNDQDVKTSSAFGSLDYKLTDTLTLQGSARYSDQKRAFTGCTQDVDGNLALGFGFVSLLLRGLPFDPNNPTLAKQGECGTINETTHIQGPIYKDLNEHNVSWRTSLNWQPNSDSLVYGNVTKGYKSGSMPTLPALFGNQLDGIPQESVLAYEIGTKLDLANKKVSLEAAAFHYDYTDKQILSFVNVPPFGSAPGLASIPKSWITGFEANLAVRPMSGLTLTIGGIYLDTKVTSDPANPIGPFDTDPPPVGTTTRSFVGQPFPFTPKWQGVADVQYMFGVSSSLDAFVGASGTAREGTRATLYNTLATGENAALQHQYFDMAGYGLLDLRAGIQPRNRSWSFEIWGRNVTDRYYVTSKGREADYLFRYAGMPVTYGATVTVNFGK
jgi:outer membrane receptor protein involved in Fe transport